ncbi:hypothetical protein Taro_000453 [Colocasia esculenta]|uniref:Uncharacterized protein n=1 Tax=Colocasia esculenta TaxID=4460 RepID=A0A843TAW8_COLES|nr:hypothetical protein [Colocasia esculenta]
MPLTLSQRPETATKFFRTEQVHKNFVKGQHPTWSDDRIQLEQYNKFVGWFRDYVDQLREQMTLPEEVTCLNRGVISQRSTVQQPHVDNRRPSVIIQRSTVQQPHVEDRRPSRLHGQESVISQRSTVQQPHELGVTISIVEDTEHTPPSHDRVEWKEQSKQSLNDVMKDILAQYDFVGKEGFPTNMADVTRFCEFSISSKLKEWRATLKREGYMKGVDGELYVMPPNERISEQSWNLLLQYWKNSKKIQETERNKINRVADQATHTVGAKSIARHNYEQQQKLGDNYSTLEAYVAAHKMKIREYPNAYTHTICEKVIPACEEKNLTNSSDPSMLTPILDDVYNGHHGGYERGRGLGWSRGAWRHNMSNEASNENVRQLTSELQHTQSELQNAMKEIDNMRAREREMDARQQEHMEAMLARERELKMRQQKQEEAMEVREREMLSQIQQMKDMLSMFISSDSTSCEKEDTFHAFPCHEVKVQVENQGTKRAREAFVNKLDTADPVRDVDYRIADLGWKLQDASGTSQLQPQRQ